MISLLQLAAAISVTALVSLTVGYLAGFIDGQDGPGRWS